MDKEWNIFTLGDIPPAEEGFGTDLAPLVHCPICEPHVGPYAGEIVSRICDRCKKE